jgi:hypothetical protein
MISNACPWRARGWDPEGLYRKLCGGRRGGGGGGGGAGELRYAGGGGGGRGALRLAEWGRALRAEGKLGRQHGSGLRAPGVAVSDATVRRLFAHVDRDGDGAIDLQVLIRAHAPALMTTTAAFVCTASARVDP